MRSGDLTDTSHLLPRPPKNPWNSSALAWTTSNTGLMEFSAQQVPDPIRPKSFQQQKRKSDFSPPLPTKQLITEDKMAAHLNSLHISKDFTAHNANTSTEEPIPGPSTAINNNNDTMDDNELDYIYPRNNAKDLEEKLKRANRITICNEIKNLQHDNNILPKALLKHYQKPCTALVIWQPPKKILGLNDNEDSDSDEPIFNNTTNKNASSLDFNNYSMDTDL